MGAVYVAKACVMSDVDWRVKGRVLLRCHAFALVRIDAMLAEANGWNEERFGGSVEYWQDCLGAVLYTAHMAKNSMELFSVIPYLLSQLGKPGVRDTCLEQFRSAPLERHDRVTLRLLAEGSPLRRHVDAVSPDGSVMHADLRAEVTRLYK